MRPGDAAWLVIVAYEVVCPPGEMLSEALDRHMPGDDKLRTALTRTVALYAFLHCVNLLPQRVDGFNWLARKFGRNIS